MYINKNKKHRNPVTFDRDWCFNLTIPTSRAHPKPILLSNLFQDHFNLLFFKYGVLGLGEVGLSDYGVMGTG